MENNTIVNNNIRIHSVSHTTINCIVDPPHISVTLLPLYGLYNSGRGKNPEFEIQIKLGNIYLYVVLHFSEPPFPLLGR